MMMQDLLNILGYDQWINASDCHLIEYMLVLWLEWGKHMRLVSKAQADKVNKLQEFSGRLIGFRFMYKIIYEHSRILEIGNRLLADNV